MIKLFSICLESNRDVKSDIFNLFIQVYKSEVLKTSLGCTKELFNVPVETVVMLFISFLVLNVITKKCSLSSSSNKSFKTV